MTVTKRFFLFVAIMAAIFGIIALGASKADAKTRHHHQNRMHRVHQSVPACTYNDTGRILCMGTAPETYRTVRSKRTRTAYIDANGNDSVIGGRPSGCPHAYCGCGLRKYLGLNDKSLDLAWNWAVKFPRTSATAGAAAVRHHHVMLLVSHVGGSVWTVRDYNGGRGLSYIHERDVRGYVFVTPSSRVARL